MNTSIAKIVKNVQPDLSITSEAKSTVVTWITVLVTALVIKDIPSLEASIRKCFRGEIATHAIMNARKILTKFDAVPNADWRNAGLVLSPLNVEKLMKIQKVDPRVLIYITTVMEYMIAEMVELGGFVTKDNRAKRITTRYLEIAIKHDIEFEALFKKVGIRMT